MGRDFSFFLIFDIHGLRSQRDATVKEMQDNNWHLSPAAFSSHKLLFVKFQLLLVTTPKKYAPYTSKKFNNKNNEERQVTYNYLFIIIRDEWVTRVA